MDAWVVGLSIFFADEEEATAVYKSLGYYNVLDFDLEQKEWQPFKDYYGTFGLIKILYFGQEPIDSLNFYSPLDKNDIGDTTQFFVIKYPVSRYFSLILKNE